MGLFYPNPHGPSCPWYEITEKFGAPNVKWCERTLCAWISEPANTWSNLGTLLIACYFIYQYRNHPSSHLRWMPIINFSMGLCSFIYHASNFYISQILDFVGMFLQVLLMVGINFQRLGWIKEKMISPFVIYATIFLTILLHLLYLNHINYQMIVLVLALIIFWTEINLNKKKKGVPNPSYFFISMALGIVAISFSILDHKGVLCDPDNHWLQGHALWHILASIMFIGLFKHYEQVLTPKYPKYILAPLSYTHWN